MIIKIIVAQRKETYCGEYAPEVIDAVDEYGFHENPSWLMEKYEEHANNKEFESVKIIDVEINVNEIYKILRPENTVLKGKIFE